MHHLGLAIEEVYYYTCIISYIILPLVDHEGDGTVMPSCADTYYILLVWVNPILLQEVCMPQWPHPLQVLALIFFKCWVWVCIIVRGSIPTLDITSTARNSGNSSIHILIVWTNHISGNICTTPAAGIFICFL